MRKFVFFIPVIIAVALLAFGGAVMLLWNAILPPVFGANTITFWQAIGLLVLCKLLFGGTHWRRHCCHPGHDGPLFLRHKWHGMSDEERETWKAQWRSRWCGSRDQPSAPADTKP